MGEDSEEEKLGISTEEPCSANYFKDIGNLTWQTRPGKSFSGVGNGHGGIKV